MTGTLGLACDLGAQLGLWAGALVPFHVGLYVTIWASSQHSGWVLRASVPREQG